MKFLTPILLIIISIATVFWYIMPGYNDILTMRAEASQYDEALDKAKQAEERRQSLIADYANFTPKQH
jgi:hypothetical protein